MAIDKWAKDKGSVASKPSYVSFGRDSSGEESESRALRSGATAYGDRLLRTAETMAKASLDQHDHMHAKNAYNQAADSHQSAGNNAAASKAKQQAANHQAAERKGYADNAGQKSNVNLRALGESQTKSIAALSPEQHDSAAKNYRDAAEAARGVYRYDESRASVAEHFDKQASKHEKLAADKRAAGGADEYARDEQGRFASK